MLIHGVPVLMLHGVARVLCHPKCAGSNGFPFLNGFNEKADVLKKIVRYCDCIATGTFLETTYEN